MNRFLHSLISRLESVFNLLLCNLLRNSFQNQIYYLDMDESTKLVTEKKACHTIMPVNENINSTQFNACFSSQMCIRFIYTLNRSILHTMVCLSTFIPSMLTVNRLRAGEHLSYKDVIRYFYLQI